MKPTNKNQRSKATRSPLTEWQIYDDEAAWQQRIASEAGQIPMPPAPRRRLPQWVWRYGAPTFIIALTLLFLGKEWLQKRPPAWQNEVADIHSNPRYIGQSHYFLFRYSAADSAAVAAAGDQLDHLYPTLYATFFPEAPAAHKIVVTIDPTLPAGLLPQLTPSSETVTIPSPTTISLPVTLSGSDILIQSLTLALFDRTADQATRRYQLPTYWLPLCNGLRLWFIWKHNLPLGKRHEQLVRWLFNGPQNGQVKPGNTRAPGLIPDFAHDLCAEDRLWMRSPIEIGIPITCRLQANGQEQILSWRYPYPPPLEEPLPVPNDVPPSTQGTNNMWHARLRLSLLAAPVALATVIDYAAATYGSQRLPNLLAALPRQANWQELFPAVFGVSMHRFEQGWHAYLSAQYGIPP